VGDTETEEGGKEMGREMEKGQNEGRERKVEK
jgi:hypothetical protein